MILDGDSLILLDVTKVGFTTFLSYHDSPLTRLIILEFCYLYVYFFVTTSKGEFLPLLSKFRGQVTELLRINEVPGSYLDFYFADKLLCDFICTPKQNSGKWPFTNVPRRHLPYNYPIYCSYIIISELELRERYIDKAVGWESRKSFSSLKISEGICKLSNIPFNWDLYAGLKRPAHESDHSIHLVLSFNKWSNTSNPPYAFMTFVMYTGLLKLSLINKNKS